ncbi:MAG: glycosyltransferase family 4 protein [Paracoccaceae bacterium]|nr:glycosyltransferase family 4 protein [Paracoccaceae bacterium]
MRIVIVEPDSQGGLIHFAYQLADALATAGAEVTLMTGQHYELAALSHRFRVAPLLRLWPPIEAQRSSLPRPLALLRRAYRALILMREWGRLTAILARDPPDVVLFSTIRFRFQALFLRALARRGVRMGQICHEFADREAGRSLGARIAKAVFPDPYRYFQTVFLFSETALAVFRGTFPIHGPRAMALPHGPEMIFGGGPEVRAQLGARYAIAPGAEVVLMFGGLRRSKGVPDLIAAFGGLAGRPDARLLIVGTPSRDFDLAGARAQIARLENADRVTLDPRYVPMTELGALVALASVAVFPYRSATASGALALAQSLGRPVVATAVGGLADAVEDGKTGRLVPPGDSAALARAIGGLLDAPGDAEAMGRAARAALLRDRGWDLVAARMLARLRADAAFPTPAGKGVLSGEPA